MSDTPRTDAFLEPVKGSVVFTGLCADFARTLERENAAMREAIKEAHGALVAAINIFGPPDIEPEKAWVADAAINLAWNNGQAALAKLQPFLAP